MICFSLYQVTKELIAIVAQVGQKTFGIHKLLSDLENFSILPIDKNYAADENVQVS